MSDVSSWLILVRRKLDLPPEGARWIMSNVLYVVAHVAACSYVADAKVAGVAVGVGGGVYSLCAYVSSHCCVYTFSRIADSWHWLVYRLTGWGTCMGQPA